LGWEFLLEYGEFSSHVRAGCSVRAVLLESVAMDQRTADLQSVKIKIY
jgi:hypothetical protein